MANRAPGGIRATWCSQCKAPILTGLDSDNCAFDARVDPTPLTSLGEFVAKLNNLTTYDVSRPSGTTRLQRRSARRIAAHPAGGCAATLGPYDVLAAHQCHVTMPPTCTTTSRLNPATREGASDVCPF